MIRPTARSSKRYPKFLGNHAAKSLMLDSLRFVVSGTASADELSHLMDENIAIQEEEGRRPTGVLDKTANTLPGLGIVAAAVLRVIIAMGAMDQGPEVIGHKIAAALVGTFLGMLLGYGILQPQQRGARKHWLLMSRTRRASPMSGLTKVAASRFNRECNAQRVTSKARSAWSSFCGSPFENSSISANTLSTIVVSGKGA